MLNKLYFLALGIFLISFISSSYAGESITIQNTLGTDNLNWLIVDNTSILSVLPLVTINSTNITINLPDNMPPNSFTIVFLENQTNIIVQTIQVSSGGHSHTIIKYVNNTKYIYVPNNTIQYVQNNTIDINNETNENVTSSNTNKPSLFLIIVVTALIVLLPYLAYIIGKRKSKSNSSEIKENIIERRLENGKYRN